MVDESLSARIDLEKYNQSCKELKNFILQPQGGIYRRPGLKFISEPALDGTPTTVGVQPTLIPLIYNSETSYIIVLLDSNYKIYSSQLYVDEGSSYLTEEQNKIADYAQSADTLYLVHKNATPFKILRLSTINFIEKVLAFSSNFTSPSGFSAVFSGGAGSTQIDYAITAVTDDGKESLAVLFSVMNGKTPLNWGTNNVSTLTWAEPGSRFGTEIIFAFSIWEATPRLSAVGAAGIGSYSADGFAWTLVGNMQFGTDVIFFVTVNPGVPRLVAVGDQGKGSYSADGITWTAIGNMQFGTTTIYEATVSTTSNWFVAVGESGKGSRSSDGITWVAIGDMKFGVTPIYGVTVNETGPRFVAIGGGGKGAYSDDNGLTWTGFTISGVSLLLSIVYASALTRFVVVGGSSLVFYSDDNGITWINSNTDVFEGSTMQHIAFSSALTRFVVVGSFGKIAFSSDGINWIKVDNSTFGTSTIYTIVYSTALSLYIAGGQDGKTATSIDGILWNVGDTPDSYNIYKKNQGVYGYIGNARGVYTFEDYNYDPITSDSIPEAYNPFIAENPGVVSLFQQRLWFANTSSKPQTIFASRIGDFENMNFSPFIRPDDSIENTIFSGSPDGVQWILPFNKTLKVGTVAKQWNLTSASGGGITPTDINIEPQLEWGASKVKPVLAGNSLLYVENKGSKLFNIYERQEYQGFTGDNLSVDASDLFEGFEIVSMAYQRTPDPIIWCVRDDGKVVALTYLKNENLWGWHRHETDGFFKNVVVIPGTVYDEVYFTIERVIESVSHFYLEMLEDKWDGENIEDAKFLDSSITKEDVTPFTIITGLDHLEGKYVAVFGDGQFIDSGLSTTPIDGLFLVFSGGISPPLPDPVNKAQVGLPYTSIMAPISSEFTTKQQGASLGKTKTISDISLRLKKSKGGKLGPRLNYLDVLKTVDYDNSVEGFTGDVKITYPDQFNTDGSFFVVQDEPLPMSIQAMFINMRMGEK